MTTSVQLTSPPITRGGRWLALGAVAGPALFEIAWLVLGFVSPGYTLFGHRFMHYSPISQPVSGLGMGVTAQLMNTAFVASGALLVAGSIGIFMSIPDIGRPTARRWSIVLLSLVGVGHVIDGLFNLEAVLVHTIGFIVGIASPVVSFLVVGRYLRRVPAWRRFGTWLMLGSPLTLILVVAFFATFQPTADGAEHGIAGLVQRLGIIEVHAWLVVMGWRAFRRG